MRKVLSVFILFGGCAAYLWVGVSGARFGITQVRPSAPATKLVALSSERYKSNSTVSLDVTFTHEALKSLIDELVPKLEKGSQKEDFGRAFSKEVVAWNMTRSGITLTINGSLEAATSVKGSVRISGIFKPIRGSVGRLIGGATDIPFSQSANIRGNIALNAKPVLNENWRLNPHASGTLNLTEASLNIANTGAISVRSLVDKELQPEKEQLIKKLNSTIATDPFIENEIRQIHNQLCQVHAFDIDGTSAWLKTVPKGWIAQQPVMDDRGLTLGLGVHVETSSGTGNPPAEPDCSFPRTLELSSTGEAGKIELKLATSLDWVSIRDAINKQLEDQRGENGWSYSNEIGTVILDSFEVDEFRGNDSTVFMKVQFAGMLDSWLDKSFEGHAWISGTPTLESSSHTLSFQNIVLDVSSQNAFSALSAFGAVTGPLLERHLVNLPPLSLDQVGDDARALVNVSLAELAEKIEVANVEVLSDVVDELRLESIHVDDNGLHVIVAANGVLALRVSHLKINR